MEHNDVYGKNRYPIFFIEKRKQELIAITARMIIKSVGLSPPCHKGVHACIHIVRNVDTNIEKKTIYTSLLNTCM